MSCPFFSKLLPLPRLPRSSPLSASAAAGRKEGRKEREKEGGGEEGGIHSSFIGFNFLSPSSTLESLASRKISPQLCDEEERSAGEGESVRLIMHTFIRVRSFLADVLAYLESEPEEVARRPARKEGMPGVGFFPS